MVKQTLFIGLLLSSIGLMADTDLSQSTLGRTSTSPGKYTSSDYRSKIWNISTDDWVQYEEIMLGKGQYFWKDLDPITVLGLNARSDQERRRYAELLAKLEYSNTQKLLLLNSAYNKAFMKLYGHIPIIDQTKLNISSAKASLTKVPSSTINATFGDHYIAFINTQCPSCDAIIHKVISSLELGVSLDIHFNTDNRHAITAWAAQQNISAGSVELGTITLNPDSSLYEKFGQPSEPSLYYFNKATNQVNEVK